MNVIVLTNCPSGSVTSYLAAQRLEPAAKAKGWQVSVEMHSNLAKVEALSNDTLAAAELVIAVGEPLAGAHRFSGKRLYRGQLADALGDPDAFLDKAARDAQVFTPLNDGAEGQSAGAVEEPGSSARIVAVTACPTGWRTPSWRPRHWRRPGVPRVTRFASRLKGRWVLRTS